MVPPVLPLLSGVHELRLYLLLFHQATLINFIECLTFHPQLILHLADDPLIELTDYCHRRILTLHSPPTPSHSFPSPDTDLDPTLRLTQQVADIDFACAACAVSVLRYVTDHIDALPLSVTARLLQGHDTLSLLLPLLPHSPFTRYPSLPSTTPTVPSTLKWVDQRWVPIPLTDLPLGHSH